MRGGLMLVLAALTLALAACGGGEKSADEKAIEDAVKRALGTDAEAGCDALTERLAKRIYGSRRACVEQARAAEDGAELFGVGAARMAGARVDGAKARAAVEKKVGDDVIGGHVRLRRVRGEWKVDDLENDFLRSSSTSTGLLRAVYEDYPDELVEKGLRCYTRHFDAMSDRELREFALGSLGGDEHAVIDDFELGDECFPRRRFGVSFQRASFEFGLVAAFEEEGVADDDIACIKRRLRKTLPDEKLWKLFDSSADLAQAQRALARWGAEARKSCGVESA